MSYCIRVECRNLTAKAATEDAQHHDTEWEDSSRAPSQEHRETRYISVIVNTGGDTFRSVQIECRIDCPPRDGTRNDLHSPPRCSPTDTSATVVDSPTECMSAFELRQAQARARRIDEEEHARKLLKALVGALAYGGVCLIVLSACRVVDIVVWGGHGVLYHVRAFIVAPRPVGTDTETPDESPGAFFPGFATVYGCISQLSQWPRTLLGHLRRRGPARFLGA